MRARKTIAATCVALAASGGMVVVASPAAADGPATVRVVRNDRVKLRDTDRADSRLRRAMLKSSNDFLDRNARQGQPMDARSVSTVSDPTGSVIATTAGNIAIDGIDVGTHVRAGSDERAQGVGIRTHETGAATTTAVQPAIGFAATPPTAEGFKLFRNDSLKLTTAHDRDMLIAGNTQVAWNYWWKYRLDEADEHKGFSDNMRKNSDFWAYARRGMADAQGTGIRLTDLTVRSRPWAGSNAFRDPIDHAPVGTANNCGGAGQFGVSAGAVGVEIPVGKCTQIVGLSNVSSKLEFGADWNGSSTTQETVEALAIVRTVEAAEPSWADYLWATFHVGSSRDVKWTDTGW